MYDFPEQPPSEPLSTVRQWLDASEAAGLRNPNAMALATCDASGRPSVRMVLLKSISEPDGFGVFYTHYDSRKGRELAANPQAAAVIYWPQAGRQIRFEGPVLRSPDAESDAYFASRPFGSRINAWISAQSEPITDPAELRRRAAAKAGELGVAGAADELGAAAAALARPPFWGGFRLWFAAVELWAEGDDRLHRRLRYERALTPIDAFRFEAGAWSAAWLQP